MPDIFAVKEPTGELPVDPECARHRASETIRIASLKDIVAQLNDAREASNLTKSRLARAIGSDPSVVGRFLSAHTENPTLATVVEVAAALGLKICLVPMSAEERARITEPMLSAGQLIRTADPPRRWS
jgi:DNA-binding phage protein